MSILNEQSQDSVYGLTGTPKTMFFLGLSMGVGSMAVIALVATVVFMVNGPVNVFAKGSNEIAAPVDVVDAAGGQVAPPAEDVPPAAPVPAVTKDDHVKGKDNAKVTLIEYSDFQCPYCVRHEETLKAVVEKYPNDVRIIYRHFPLSSLHPLAQKAAEASECASAQGKFWEMHEKIFALTDSAGGLTIDGMKAAAKDLKLDEGKFNTCLDKGEMASKVSKMYQDGMAAGVSGTPAVFINGQIIEGAVPLEQFESMVKAAGAQS